MTTQREAFEAAMNERGITPLEEYSFLWGVWMAAQAAAIPDGYVLVPREPCMSACLRGEEVLKDEFGYAQRKIYAERIYKTMIRGGD